MLTYAILFCLLFQYATAIYFFGAIKKTEVFDASLRMLLLVLFVHLSIKFLLLNRVGNTFLFARAATGFTFFYGPFLFIITRRVLQLPLSKRMMYAHLSPFFAGLLMCCLVNLLGYTGSVSYHFIVAYNNVYQVLAILSLVGYSVMVKIKSKQSRGNGASIVDLQKQLLGNVASVWIIGIVSGLLIKSIPLPGSVFAWLDLRLIVYGNLLMIPVLAIRYRLQSSDVGMQSSLWLAQMEEPEPKITIVEVPKKYKKSGVDESLFLLYEEKITRHMKKSKPYLNTGLSLEDLSKQLDIPRHHLTQTLNDKMNTNFYQLINEYRIAEAIMRLKKNKDEVNLLSLAFDVGFNSKSSFNMYFKKITGATPSSYRKSMTPAGEKS